MNKSRKMSTTSIKEIKYIDDVIQFHGIFFMIYTAFTVGFLLYYIYTLSKEMAVCENNPSRFCPVIYDTTGIVNKPNPNADID